MLVGSEGVVIVQQCKNGRVICIFKIKCGGGRTLTVIRVEGVEERAEHTPLRSTSIERDGGGQGLADPHCLGSVGEEAVDPVY